MKGEGLRYIKQLPVNHETRNLVEENSDFDEHQKNSNEQHQERCRAAKKASGRQSVKIDSPSQAMAFVDQVTPCKVKIVNGHAVPVLEDEVVASHEAGKTDAAVPRRARHGSVLKMDRDEFIAKIVKRNEGASAAPAAAAAESGRTPCVFRRRKSSALRDLQAYHEITGAEGGRRRQLVRKETQTWRNAAHRVAADTSRLSAAPVVNAAEGEHLLPELRKIEGMLKQEQADEMKALTTIAERTEHQQEEQQRDRALLVALGEKIDKLNHSVQQLKRMHAGRGRRAQGGGGH